MAGAKTLHAYNPKFAAECLAVLAKLLSGIGPWRDSIVLVGGLTPQILVTERPPAIPPHAGTGDVDLVLDVAILGDTKAYSSFEENLAGLGFEPVDKEEKSSWRWQTRTACGTTIRIEFLADDPELGGGKIKALPASGKLSACNIPHASIVFDLFEEKEIVTELPDGEGVTKQIIRHADIVGFTVLKILAFRHRAHRKDAYDLVYCIEHAPGGPDGIAPQFAAALRGKHGAVIGHALKELEAAFGDEDGLEGYRKDGPTAVAHFEIAGAGDDVREARLLRQRDVAATITALLDKIGRPAEQP